MGGGREGELTMSNIDDGCREIFRTQSPRSRASDAQVITAVDVDVGDDGESGRSRSSSMSHSHMLLPKAGSNLALTQSVASVACGIHAT